MDKKDLDELINSRKRERKRTRTELINRAEITTFFDDPHVTPQKKKEERILREIIRDRQMVMSKKEMAGKAKKVLGKGVSVKRIGAVQDRMKQEDRMQFGKMNSFEAAFNAFSNYAELKDQLGKLILEAELITDPKDRVKTKALIMDRYKQTQEAEDRMFKMAGIHKEQIILEQLDVRDTKQWKSFQSAILIYLRYVLTCPDCGYHGFDPEHFLNFVDRVSRDPSYIDEFINKQTRMNRAHRKAQTEETVFKDYIEVLEDDYEDLDEDEDETKEAEEDNNEPA